LSFTECSGCDRDATLRTVDIFFSDRTSAPGTDSAIGIFGSVQVDAKQNIVGIFGSGFWSAFRAWSRWGSSLGLTSGDKNPAATLFAFHGFTGGLIRYIQDRLTTFTSYLDRHIQSRPAHFAVWGQLSCTISRPQRSAGSRRAKDDLSPSSPETTGGHGPESYRASCIGSAKVSFGALCHDVKSTRPAFPNNIPPKETPRETFFRSGAREQHSQLSSNGEPAAAARSIGDYPGYDA
jgi:hypothetical protein